MGYQCCWLTALISIKRVVWKIEYQSTESLITYKVKFMKQDVHLSCVWTSYKVKRTLCEAEKKKETEVSFMFIHQ